MADPDCMPQGLTYDAGLTSCPTTTKLLVTLGIFNFEAALLSLVIGHDSVRRTIRRYITPCLHGNTWTPWTAIMMSVVHIIAMAVSTVALRSNGFYPNAFMVFGLWTMRPRASIATPIWHLLSGCLSSEPHYHHPYLWSFKDDVLQENLLNIFALPFALWYIENRPPGYEEGSCASSAYYVKFWDSFYVIAGAGALSLVLLVLQILHWCTNRHKADYKAVHVDKMGRLDTQRISGFWKVVLTLGAVNMLVTFATQWVIWSTFIINTGTDFCPGSLIGEGVAWGVAILLNAFLRPIIGGAPDC